jgi:NAD(P)-dependent dehydrogenase (short-subunit alcohol dehydrogenase family)
MSVAVVTGGSRGLGQAIAVALAKSGHDIVIGYESNDVGAKETALLVEEQRRSAVLVQGDVSKPGINRALGAAALEVLGGLDVWVSNAGVSALAPLVDTPPTVLRRMLDVNVMGVFHGLREAVGRMRASGRGGRIINVASECGLQAFPLLGAYSATKFAVVGLTQAAALELADDGITVNAVCPGTAETDMVFAERDTEAELTGTAPQAVRAKYLDAIPAGRFCTPEDVGGLVAYMASPAAAYMTGQAIAVNGGSVLH